MFAKLLIANRGEIACRIMRTARRLGIRTVALYSEADAGALHVTMADEAHAIGPAPARDSYLAIPRIIEAARRSGAEAIHPGYGFLSENADFAAACEASGVVFVGPPAAAIRAMGDKARAKALMERAGVPVVPGYHGAAQDEARFLGEARRLGFPVLVKAAAGGGGRGMRVVAAEPALAEAMAAARREAESAFGDGRLILEKYLAQPRHIEMQIFADRGGQTIHLWERDCSVQRRHQKVVEEAPAPGLDEARRQALGAAAVAAARAVGYVGAGTVEFIAEGDAFYFIEMNTRLQVEHPVTEMITGLDLVEWQLRIAAGEALPLRQEQVEARGHAVEARLYAEDPLRDFLPATGVLARLRFPAASAALRLETGLREGDAVSVHYDPLLAKLVAWGEDRAAALRRLQAALAETSVAGLACNRDFLLRLLAHPDFAAGAADTGFIARHAAQLLAAAAPSRAALAVASLAILSAEERLAAQAAADSDDRFSPWQRRDGWRLDGAAARELQLRDGDAEHRIEIMPAAGGYRLMIDGGTAMARRLEATAGDIAIELEGERLSAAAARQGAEWTVALPQQTVRLVLHDPLAASERLERGARRLVAPMPGKVIEVRVAAGASVACGDVLMVIEAMKMEHAIVAPAEGRVEAVHHAAGDFVEEGALLLAFTSD